MMAAEKAQQKNIGEKMGQIICFSKVFQVMHSSPCNISNNTTPSLSHSFSSKLCSIKLHAAKGLQPLVDLLSSYDKEVLHHACLVINVCATEEPSAIEMQRLG